MELYYVMANKEVCSTFNDFKDLTGNIEQTTEDCARLEEQDPVCSNVFATKRKSSTNCMCLLDGDSCGDETVSKSKWGTYELADFKDHYSLLGENKKWDFYGDVIYNGEREEYSYEVLSNNIESAFDCAKKT